MSDEGMVYVGQVFAEIASQLTEGIFSCRCFYESGDRMLEFRWERSGRRIYHMESVSKLATMKMLQTEYAELKATEFRRAMETYEKESSE